MHHIRFFLIGDEATRFVLGQAGIYLGQDFGVLAVGVELLQLRSQAGALGRGGGEGINNAYAGSLSNVYCSLSSAGLEHITLIQDC
ncbi:MAG: hypothetical protein PHS80_09220 [Methanothrix sp.]|nr:hypothetical protein [Methanothrix sp.]MDD4447115.1 hypothetical protein [Methanothrix sp.]